MQEERLKSIVQLSYTLTRNLRKTLLLNAELAEIGCEPDCVLYTDQMLTSLRVCHAHCTLMETLLLEARKLTPLSRQPKAGSLTEKSDVKIVDGEETTANSSQC